MTRHLLRLLTLTLLLVPLACSKDKSEQGGVAHAAGQPGQGPGGGAATKPRPAPRGAEHAVFSLIDNRLLAHVQRGGGVVALAGHPGFAKYLRFAKPNLKWKLGEKQDGKRVARPEMYATVELPLTAEQAAAAKEVVVRVHSETARRMTIIVNDKPAATVELTAGWQTARAPLADGQARGGENIVQLVPAKGPQVAVEWIQLGGVAQGDDAPPLYDAESQALVLPQGGGIAYYVMVPTDGRLVGDVIGAGCQIAVSAQGHGGDKADGVLKGEAAAVELASLAGKIVRLDLTPGGCPVAKLARAELAVPGAAPVVERPKKPKHIVFWLMDSMRADRIATFTPGARPEVPVFDRLLKEAAFFRSCYSQGNETRASHAAIWSSQYNVNHGMIRDGAKLAPKWTTLGEAMKAAGFYTSGVTANGYIWSKWGFGDGWDAFRNHIHEGGGVRGEDVLKYSIASVEKHLEKPFFLFIGTIDTHVSWRAKEPWFSKYDPAPYSGRFVKEASGKDIEAVAGGKLQITDRDKVRIRAIYDSNVSYQDDLLGKFVDKLKEWGVAEDTMIVVTGDHGDEQWEAGRVGHGGSLRESLIHVPLVIYYPPLFKAGMVEEGVDTLDIVPTLVDAMGLAPADDWQGESLLALTQGVGRGYPRPSISSQYEFAHAMRLGGWKARVAGSAVPQLYDMAKDKEEKNDLGAARPIERRFITDAFSTFLVYQKDWRKARWGVASNHKPQLAADLEK